MSGMEEFSLATGCLCTAAQHENAALLSSPSRVFYPICLSFAISLDWGGGVMSLAFVLALDDS